MGESVRKPKKTSMWRKLTFKTAVMVIVLMLILGTAVLISGLATYIQSALYEARANTCALAKAEKVMIDMKVLKEKTSQILDIYDSMTEEERQAMDPKEYKKLYVDVLDMEFRDLQSSMRTMQNEVGLRNAFIVAMDEEKNRMIYIVDADPRPASFCFPGTWDDYSEEEVQVLVHGMAPTKIQKRLGLKNDYQATITNTKKFGLRCTGGETLFKTDKYTVVVCLDETLGHITTMGKFFFMRYLAFLAAVVAISALIAIFFIRSRVVKPITKMAGAARDYSDDKLNGIAAPNRFSALKIKTHDEIEELSDSMKDMEKNLIEYEEDLTKITAERERIATELNLAKNIQKDMLPSIFPPFPERTEFDLYATMDPAKEVGGDFYDFFLIDDDHLGLLIADVSGKGIPAALFMMVCKTILNNMTMTNPHPADVMEQANNTICANNKEEMFVTVWLGVLEISTGIIRAANAGHERPVIIHHDGRVEEIKDKHGFVVGGMAGMKYKEYELALEPDDKLFVYTDGVAEATDAHEELFGTDRLLTALGEDTAAEPKEVLANVRSAVDRFVGDAEQFDDLTMLCLSFRG